MPNTKFISFVVTVALSCALFTELFLLIYIFQELIHTPYRDRAFANLYQPYLFGMILGLIHGLTTIFVIRRRGSKTLFEISFSTVLAGEICLAYPCLFYFIWVGYHRFPDIDFISFIENLWFIGCLHLFAGLIILIPSTVIGIINNKIFDDVLNKYKFP